MRFKELNNLERIDGTLGVISSDPSIHNGTVKMFIW